MKKICVEDIDNHNFWINYFGSCYPNGYDVEEDVSASELMQELYTDEVGNWWEKFTGYYEGVLDESDGYVDDPTTLEEVLLQDKILKIEFHPGDILYFINDEQIGSTGPHWELQTIPYKEVEQLLAKKNGRQLFLLLLPLAYIEEEEVPSVREKIAEQMRNYFSESLCESVSGCIVAGLAVSDD
ncbi:MAG: immunity protein 19 [Lachnospiraceae bacterium]|nr:immunity protein 19 [Lachnospiraceae bacterium]